MRCQEPEDFRGELEDGDLRNDGPSVFWFVALGLVGMVISWWTRR